MERSEHFEATVALGKKLVSELDLEHSVDTLGRWMAHHIAESIQQIEVASVDEIDARKRSLRDSILALWDHRSALPNGTRPFEEIEPILRAMESLDPESQRFRYLSSSWGLDSEHEESEETTRLINTAKGIDYAARILINYCLSSAARSALDKTKSWVKSIEEAGLEDTVEVQLVRFISNQDELTSASEPDDGQKEVLRERYEKLDAFILLATIVANDMKTKLGPPPP